MWPAAKRSRIAVRLAVELVRIGAAQPVIGAELDDRGVRLVGEHPVEPRPAAGAGVARDAAIEDRDVVAGLLQRVAELGLESLVVRQAVAGGQAVAEGEQADGAGPGGRRQAEQRE